MSWVDPETTKNSDKPAATHTYEEWADAVQAMGVRVGVTKEQWLTMPTAGQGSLADNVPKLAPKFRNAGSTAYPKGWPLNKPAPVQPPQPIPPSNLKPGDWGRIDTAEMKAFRKEIGLELPDDYTEGD